MQFCLLFSISASKSHLIKNEKHEDVLHFIMCDIILPLKSCCHMWPVLMQECVQRHLLHILHCILKSLSI